jgi:CubicO group peptidase (beta-lactamase class C family)
MLVVFRHWALLSYGLAPAPIDKLLQPSPYSEPSLEALSRRVAQVPLLYQPGTRWMYSFSHDIQAHLVEVLSGKSFDDYTRERIFEPLGMNEVVFGLPARLADRFANTYSPDETGQLVATDTPENTTYDLPPFGGTSLSGPVTDYARFAQMLVNSGELDGARILSPKTVDLMAANHLPDGVTRGAAGGGEASGEGYGLGVRVVVDAAKAGNLTSAGTFGWSGAAGTHFFVDREEQLTAILMVQRQGRGGLGMSDQFETLVYQAIVD